MQGGRLTTRMRALGVLGALGVGLLLGSVSPQVVFAAAPKISAKVVGNAGTLKVTGSGFPRNTAVTVEFNPNWSDSFIQDFSIRSDRRGRISITEQANVTASCIMGIIAVAASMSSNLLSLDTSGQGCTPARVSAVEQNPFNDDRFALTGSNFTPGGSVTYTFADDASGAVLATGTLTACGTLNPGPYPPLPAGQLGPRCTGVLVFSTAVCAEQPSQQIDVSASDDDTGYTTPTIHVFNHPRNTCP
jgi:hypothetical protein